MDTTKPHVANQATTQSATAQSMAVQPPHKAFIYIGVTNVFTAYH
nr:MAG TPA: hypothetical protein [Caudoviricetes sp.]DAT06966.1 MAG TPA: hypothetical protein [Caudoviricetes sp.]